MPEPIKEPTKIDDIGKKLNQLPISDPLVDDPSKDKPKEETKDKRDKSNFNQDEFNVGVKIEHEHKPTFDMIAKYIKENNGNMPHEEKVYESITTDHVSEYGNYYNDTTGLPNMERILKGSGEIKSNLGKREGIKQEIIVKVYEGINPENNDDETYTVIENITYPEKITSFYIKNEQYTIPELVSRSNIEIDSNIPDYCKEIETIEGLSDNVKRDIENSKKIMQQETHDMDYENKARKRLLKSSKKDENAMIEKLAELEHEQWINWSKDIAKKEDLSQDRLNRWKEYWIDYSKLKEDVKEEDRKWARKVLKIFKGIIENEIKGSSNVIKENKMAVHKFEIMGKKYTGISDGNFIYLTDIDAQELGIDKIELHPTEIKAEKNIKYYKVISCTTEGTAENLTWLQERLKEEGIKIEIEDNNTISSAVDAVTLSDTAKLWGTELKLEEVIKPKIKSASTKEEAEEKLWDIAMDGFQDETEIYFEYGSDKAIDIIYPSKHEELSKEEYPAFAYLLWTSEQGFRNVEAVDNEEEKNTIIKNFQGIDAKLQNYDKYIE